MHDLTTEQKLSELKEAIAYLEERLDEQPLTYNAQVFDLGDPRYVLTCPIIVTIEVYQGETVARVPDFDLYASGVSDSVALSKLKREITSTYERLEELGRDNLGPLALQHLLGMRKIIERAHE